MVTRLKKCHSSYILSLDILFFLLFPLQVDVKMEKSSYSKTVLVNIFLCLHYIVIVERLRGNKGVQSDLNQAA